MRTLRCVRPGAGTNDRLRALGPGSARSTAAGCRDGARSLRMRSSRTKPGIGAVQFDKHRLGDFLAVMFMLGQHGGGIPGHDGAQFIQQPGQRQFRGLEFTTWRTSIATTERR